MARPTLYVAITNHGFGHVARTTALVNAIRRQVPDLLPLIVTAAPYWLLQANLEGEFIHRPRALDLGVVQADSLQMDLPATRAKLLELQAAAPELIRAEAEFIQQNRAQLVLADIPPLAVAIAHAAGVPCWMVSNFGWDFIYRSFGDDFSEIADWVSNLYSGCDRLFQLPFAEPLNAFPHKEPVGLTGAEPRFEPEELRQRLGLTTPRDRTVLLTFGGLSLQAIPYETLKGFPDWQFLTFDTSAPEDLPNLRKLCGRQLRPVDVMPLCGRVVSKPGYGTYAEACRLGVPVATIRRDDFAEGPVLVAGLQAHHFHQILSHEEFFGGHWHFLHAEPQPPQDPTPLDLNGNSMIATAVAYYLNNCSSQ
ncbi:glycosyl transferase [Thermosynechococcus sp. QS41]|uniref:glycosyl transferase n=1 Tax=Thermosynechococcus sp. QS41 TaxID=3074101 RepID=UPI0028774DD8|nr:glycosyl transferase [Thermosynechococcus sp. QS41]WNC59283.1 glycosyl transferase [Thermosynechococcus sp. QS41]